MKRGKRIKDPAFQKFQIHARFPYSSFFKNKICVIKVKFVRAGKFCISSALFFKGLFAAEISWLGMIFMHGHYRRCRVYNMGFFFSCFPDKPGIPGKSADGKRRNFSKKSFVKNATPSIMAVHENHPQPRNLGGEEAFKEERRRNTKLAGPNKLHLDDANFIFEKGRIRKPRMNLKFLKRRILYTFPALHPAFGPPIDLTRSFYSLFRPNGNRKNFG